jgi:predicted nucleic acid-binding protein
LTDSGPIVALLNSDDQFHAKIVLAMPHVQLPMLTTLPVLTEAMYFLGDRYGWQGQLLLWKIIDEQRIVVGELNDSALLRMKVLMEKYADTPMDFADASLVALAESVDHRDIFTLDSDFDIYRVNNKQRLLRFPR